MLEPILLSFSVASSEMLDKSGDRAIDWDCPITATGTETSATSLGKVLARSKIDTLSGGPAGTTTTETFRISPFVLVCGNSNCFGSAMAYVANSAPHVAVASRVMS